jgi:hypothetical protein
MAKGQKRSNREIRKPKTVKAAASAAPTSLMAKGTLGSTSATKKKD